MKKKSSNTKLSSNAYTAVSVLLAILLFAKAQDLSAQRRFRQMEDPDVPGVAEVIDETEDDSSDGDTEEAPTSPVTNQDSNKTASSGSVEETQTEINVKNADIAAVVRIFSKKTKRNYILDERVKGKVSIYLPGKVSADESLKILDSVLALKGFTAVPLGENLWKIIPSKEAKQSTIPTIKDKIVNPSSNTVVTKIINLKYIAADEAREVVTQLVSPDGLVSAYGGTNALLMIDYEDNVKRLVDILDTVDVPFSNREMTIIPIKNADAPDIQKKLAEILGLGEGSSDNKGQSSTGGSVGAPDLLRARMNNNSQGGIIPSESSGATTGSEAASGSSIKSRTLEPKVIADERTNSIVVVADDETTARIRALVAQLDSELDLSGQKFYVYRCQHAKAAELAETLAGLMGGQTSGGASSGGSNLLDMGGSDGTAPVNNNSRNRGNQFGSTQDRLSGQRRTPGRSRSENTQAPSGPTSVQLGDNIAITADTSTNSLIINAGKSDYEKIKTLLMELDIKRRQVLVEAMLLEVRVTEQGDYGFDWLSSTGGKDGGVLAKSDFGPSQNSLASLFSNPNAISGFSVAASSSGSLTLPGGITIPSQSVLLTAAQSNTNVNVLSAPNILTTDNEQAEIVVGENVPFLASRSTTTQNIDNVFNQIDRQDVGITLRLTPQISSQSIVNLKIFTEVSAIQSTTDLGPITSVRTSETSVIAKDGQMVVIGGLLADAKNESDGGVPFLKDVPLLGWAFKSANEQIAKTNLLIFITPRIVQDQFDMRDLTKEQRDVVKDEIDRRGIYPDRNEQLNNPKMDAVVEAKEFDGAKPSTIKPSDKATSDDSTAAAAPSAPAVINRKFSADTPGVIQLKVQPKLPKASLNVPSTTESLSTNQTAKRFVLLQAPKDAKPSSDSFVWSSETRVFGIEVPDGSANEALSFFTPGSTYEYQNGDTELDLKVQSTWSDRASAQSSLPGSSIAWYTLSPKEVMSLGSNIWKRK